MQGFFFIIYRKLSNHFKQSFRSFKLKFIYIICFVFLCGGYLEAHEISIPTKASKNNRAEILETFELPPTDISILNANIPLDAAEYLESKGYKGRKYPGIGSGLIRVPKTKNEFYMLTDRGPNFDNVNGVGKVYGKIFPIENFAPAIIRVKLENKNIQIIKSIPIVDSEGKSVTGISNGKDDEVPFNIDEKVIAYRPGGVDTEAIQLLPDGNFLISEEYGPSILVVDPSGKVLMRYLPRGKAMFETPYPIKDTLPEVLKNRRSNRGFESLALSPDGKTAFAILQSPMGDPKSSIYMNSRVVRIVRLDCKNPLDIKVTGMFVVLQSDMSEYPSTSKQADLKYSDAAMLSSSKILLLERAAKKVKLIVADLQDATNIIDLPVALSLEPEEKSESLNALHIKPAETSVVFNSVDVLFQLDTDKLEGLAILSPAVVAVSNDNDFALGENTTNYPSRVWFIQLGKDLPIGE
jgi:alkaline phosphatase